jgi:hypothetical protein
MVMNLSVQREIREKPPTAKFDGLDGSMKGLNSTKIYIVDSNQDDPEADAWGPFTQEMALAVLDICIRAGRIAAKIVEKGLDKYREQIEAGLQPYDIQVAIIDGEPQLPADVRLTWPPAENEGIQDSTPDCTRYFVWALNERDALLRLARLNRSTPRAKAEAA